MNVSVFTSKIPYSIEGSPKHEKFQYVGETGANCHSFCLVIFRKKWM